MSECGDVMGGQSAVLAGAKLLLKVLSAWKLDTHAKSSFVPSPVEGGEPLTADSLFTLMQFCAKTNRLNKYAVFFI